MGTLTGWSSVNITSPRTYVVVGKDESLHHVGGVHITFGFAFSLCEQPCKPVVLFWCITDKENQMMKPPPQSSATWDRSHCIVFNSQLILRYFICRLIST